MIYAEQRIDVSILSFSRSRIQDEAHSGMQSQTHVALLSPVEIALGASFLLPNAEDAPLQGKVVGCVQKGTSSYVVLGAIEPLPRRQRPRADRLP